MIWSENIEVYINDCLELMGKYENNFFDLAIVDPPYGINISNNIGRRKGEKKSNYKKVDWDKEPPKDKYFEELIRISKNQIIWGGNYFKKLCGEKAGKLKTRAEVNSFIGTSKNWLIWDKKFSDEVSFSSCELAWCSFEVNPIHYKIELAPNRKLAIHPTQKPVKLYEWILLNYAEPGFKIIDTHLGSGSIAIACKYAGCSLIATEIDKSHFINAYNRFNKITSQKKLF